MLLRTLFDRISTSKLNLFQKITTFAYSTKSRFQDYELISNEFPVDEKYFRNEQNHKRILDNIRAREMCTNFAQLFDENLSAEQLSDKLVEVAKTLPNDFHPMWNDCEHQMKIIEHVGSRKEFDFKPLRAEELLHNMRLAYFSSTNQGGLGIFGGPRSYVFIGQLAKLAQALARWTMSRLINEYNFIPVITPNLIYADIVRACGFEPFGDRSQVYSLEGRSNVCLAGTAEMPLASLNLGENFSTEKDLPKRYCTLSRCYRAEAKSSREMSGLYRVHYFDKVEMFALTEAEAQKSDQMLEEFVSIEKSLFQQLELHFRVLDMPPNELGPPAYRKLDIEAYMPGRDFWGEISSASNCTDYQSKRLNITYNKFYFDDKNKSEDVTEVKKNHVHTINGTACAIPRIIIAIVEQNQTADQRFIIIPKVLHPYMKCDRIETRHI